MDRDTETLYEAVWAFTHPMLPKVRAVSGYWKDDTLYLTVYYQGELSDEETEDITDATGLTISNFHGTFLEEQMLRWDEPKPLPLNQNWLYPPPKEWVDGLDAKQTKLSERVRVVLQNKSLPFLRGVCAEWSAIGSVFISYFIQGSGPPKVKEITEDITKEIMEAFPGQKHMSICLPTNGEHLLPNSPFMAWMRKEECGGLK